MNLFQLHIIKHNTLYVNNIKGTVCLNKEHFSPFYGHIKIIKLSFLHNKNKVRRDEIPPISLREKWGMILIVTNENLKLGINALDYLLFIVNHLTTEFRQNIRPLTIPLVNSTFNFLSLNDDKLTN